MDLKVSLIIPVYNEEATLPILFQRLWKLEKENSSVSWEFIFVNDGSRDGSENILKEVSSQRQNCCVINFSKNFGHQIAVTAGMDHATGDAVGLIDADLQDPPEVIVRMIELWRAGYYIVYGKRRSREGETYFKKKTAELFYKLIARLTKNEIPVDTGDFRLMDRKVVDVMKEMRESNRFVRGLVAWTGFSSVACEYDRKARVAGETKYPFKKMLKFATDAILSFSDFPLKLASYIGWMTTLIGFLSSLLIIYLKLFTALTVPGISAVLVAIIFFGGIQLSILGIVGEYLARVFTETKGRPLYIVRSTMNIGGR